MEQEKLNAYSVRITQASRTELVVITFEIIEDSIKSAKQAFEENDTVIYEKELKRAQKLFHELTGSLDYRYGLSRELLELYRFCGKCIVDAIYGKKVEELSAVLSVAARLKTAFLEVSKQDKGGNVMQNTQSVYTGLTYGKHAQNNDVYLSNNEANRGFRA